MKPSGPLTKDEIAVFGADAVRDPVTGIPGERGRGSAYHDAMIAEQERRELAARAPAGPLRVEQCPSAAEVPPARMLDLRTIHPFPATIQ
jgi:hypothetical protein